MCRIFEDVMNLGIALYECRGFLIPDYLKIERIYHITLEDHLNPSELESCVLYEYNKNIYLTDESGNIAFIDCKLKITSPTSTIRKTHSEYRTVSRNGHDAGHIARFGASMRN